MLIPRRDLDRIVRGKIDIAFRRWRRPTVKAGGSLTTAVGVLAVNAVDRVQPSDVSAADARRAGYASQAELFAAVGERTDTDLYRIELRYSGADPRIRLRHTEPDADELAALESRLQRLDRTGSDGPWTLHVLETIRDNEAVRAADLATAIGRETAKLKRDVGKLKNLGLTESLEVGYRLSPRGRRLLEWLQIYRR